MFSLFPIHSYIFFELHKNNVIYFKYDHHSKGGKTGATKKCTTCDGRGARPVMRQLGPGMIQQILVPCNVCEGQGEMIKEKDRCKKCKGAKVVKEKKMLDIFIEKGMADGQKIVMAGEGDQEVCEIRRNASCVAYVKI